MSGELEITGGGAIAVDPEQMRAVAERMSAVAARLADAGESIRRAHHTLSAAWSAAARLDLAALGATARALTDGGEELKSDAVGTGIMADAFELADLRARHEMLSIRQPAEADRLQERIDELVASYPELDAMATHITASWRTGAMQGLLDQPIDRMTLGPWRYFGLFGMIYRGLLHAIASDRGVLPAGERLRGTPPPVTVDEVSRRPVAAAPHTLTQLARRIPGGETQVAVEKRTHRDGSQSFAVYVDGTRKVLVGEDPWDMGSNWDLYVDREPAAAHAAVLEALVQAGAEPGQRVDMVGYSQGGAIVASVAMSGIYETRRVMLIGSPVVPTLAENQTLVHVRHTDDPVGTGLTAGGPAGSTGAVDSVAIAREYATGNELSSASAHPFSGYLDTLALAERSGDARIAALEASLRAEADDIVAVERTEYRASRP